MPRPAALNWLTLSALFLPAAVFLAGLVWLRDDRTLGFLGGQVGAPWQLFAIASSGGMATAAGVGDWLFHRRGLRSVGAAESRAELLALAGGGAPLFFLMAAASVAANPAPYLVPVMGFSLLTAALISYDEWTFHRRCARLETVLHRTLVFGNGAAFLSWVHWCFGRGAPLG